MYTVFVLFHSYARWSVARLSVMEPYSVSQTGNPLKFSGVSSQMVGNYFVQILRACYAFLSTLDYKCLFTYLKLWQSYAILSASTQFISYAQNVHHRPKRPLAFSDIFPKQLVIFSRNFTLLLHVPIYVRLQIFIQLSPTMTKLCHATTQRAFRPMVDILSIWWWSRLIWHNFVKVAHNWINVCSPA